LILMNSTSTPGLRALIILTALNLLNYLDRYLVHAALPLIMVDLALSPTQGGVLVSAFVVGYVLFSPIFGYMGDRMARPRLMVIGVFLWSVATIFSGLVSGFLTLLLVRAVVGVGEASFATIAPGYLKDIESDPVKLTRYLGIFTSAIPVGSALGFVLSGVISEYWSWQAAFWCGGIPGLILLLWLARLPEVRTATSAVAPPIGEALTKILAKRILVLAIAGYVLQAFALNGVAAFITSLGVERGVEAQQMSWIFGIVLVAAGFLGTLLGSRIGANWASKASDPSAGLLKFVALSSALGVPFLVAAFLVQDFYALVVLCFIAELLIFAGTGPVNSAIVQSSPAGTVTVTQGATIFALNLGGTLLAPVVIGFGIEQLGSVALSLQLCSVALLLASVVWWMGGRVARC
jgi:MFS family permease